MLAHRNPSLAEAGGLCSGTSKVVEQPRDGRRGRRFCTLWGWGAVPIVSVRGFTVITSGHLPIMCPSIPADQTGNSMRLGSTPGPADLPRHSSPRLRWQAHQHLIRSSLPSLRRKPRPSFRGNVFQKQETSWALRWGF